MRKEIGPAKAIPKGYGLAWRYPHKSVIVYYPIPLNWIYRLARAFWISIVVPRPWQTELLDCYKRMWGSELQRNQELEKQVQEYKFKAEMYDYQREQAKGVRDES